MIESQTATQDHDAKWMQYCDAWGIDPNAEIRDEDDRQCVCGVYESEHLLCGCEQFIPGPGE